MLACYVGSDPGLSDDVEQQHSQSDDRAHAAETVDSQEQACVPDRLCSYGLYSYGLHSHGIYTVMAYTVIANTVVAYIGMVCPGC